MCTSAFYYFSWLRISVIHISAWRTPYYDRSTANKLLQLLFTWKCPNFTPIFKDSFDSYVAESFLMRHLLLILLRIACIWWFASLQLLSSFSLSLFIVCLLCVFWVSEDIWVYSCSSLSSFIIQIFVFVKFGKFSANNLKTFSLLFPSFCPLGFSLFIFWYFECYPTSFLVSVHFSSSFVFLFFRLDNVNQLILNFTSHFLCLFKSAFEPV